jgi:hypothetical protein
MESTTNNENNNIYVKYIPLQFQSLDSDTRAQGCGTLLVINKSVPRHRLNLAVPQKGDWFLICFYMKQCWLSIFKFPLKCRVCICNLAKLTIVFEFATLGHLFPFDQIVGV